MTPQDTNPNQLTGVGGNQSATLPTRNEQPPVSTLTNMMRKFFEAYVAGGMRNATEAARVAGYAHPNKSGPRLLKDTAIQDAIEDTLRQQVMSRDEFLRRLSSHARAEYTEFFRLIEPDEQIIDEETGEILPPNTNGRLYFGPDVPFYLDVAALFRAGKQHLLQNIKRGKYGPEIEFPDVQNALIHVGKVYGAFVDVAEDKGKVPDALARLLDDINDRYPVNV